MPDFLPRRDADLRNWMRIFSAAVAADYAALGLTLAQSDELAARFDAYAAAAEIADDPNTRTRVSVATKDQTRDAARRLVRQLASILRATPGVATEQLLTLGIHPRKLTRTPVNPPRTAPTLHLLAKADGGLTVQLSDVNSPASRGMPRNVARATIFIHVGEAPPVALDGWTFLRHSSRARVKLAVPPGTAPGSKVWLCAQWGTRRGQAGPLATPISTIADTFFTTVPRLRAAA